MLAKRTITPTVFSGAIALAALQGCSLQDYDSLGAGNSVKTDDETEEPDETTEVATSSPASVETLTSETTEVTSGPDASVTSDAPESEAGTPSTTEVTSSSPPVATSETVTSSSTAVETSVPPETTEVEETTDVWVPGPVVVDPNNLLTGTNTTFESGFGDWTPLGGAVLQIATNAAYTGTKSLYGAGRTQSWEGPSFELLDILEQNKQYVVSGWVRTNIEGEGQGFHIVRKAVCIYEGGVVETENAEIYLQLASTYTDHNWIQIVTPPFSLPDCELQTFVIYFEGPAPGKTFYLDDVSVVALETPDASP